MATMAFTAKSKDDRILLRVDEDMGRVIRAKAELQHRAIQDQTRHFIALGILHETMAGGKESLEDLRQLLSSGVKSG